METTTAVQKDAKSMGQSVKDFTSSAWDSTKDTASSVWDSTKDTTSSAWDSTKDTASSAWDGTKESLSTAKENTKSVLDDAKESAVTKKDSVKENAQRTIDCASANTETALETTKDKSKSTIESAKDLTHNAVTELTKIPTNLRDYFFSDPHFELSWEHYDKIKEHILGVSADLWHKFDHQLRSLSYTPPAEQGEVEKKESDQKTNTPFPRYWMLPSIPELKEKVMNLNLFQEVDNELIRFKEDDTGLEVSLDTHTFKPDEINVTVDKGILYLTGKHEDISENKKHITIREFRRMYTLPEGMGKDDVVSNLSADGILVVAAKSQKAL